MTNKFDFKIVVEQAGKVVYSEALSYENVANIVDNYEDSAKNNDFFALAITHPSASVRENIARKDKICEEIVNSLMNDPSVSVLRTLVRSAAFKEHASQEVVERLVNFDTEIVQTVAGDFESFQQINSSKMLTVLMGLDDPSILYYLAGNYNTPKKVLKELQNHSDPYVASEARRRLEG